MIGEPGIAYREAQPSMGIRTVTPFRGMFAVVRTLLNELRRWVKGLGIADEGPFFLRYHVIDMKGPMGIGVGFVVPSPLPGDERVKPAILPAGRYACRTYLGSDLKAMRTLFAWAEANGVRLECLDDPSGDAFGCRMESYLTDYRLEPRKTQWEKGFAIKLADAHNIRSTRMNWTLEVVVVPVSDLDRAKAFYVDGLGFNVDHDTVISDEVRVIQLTPPGSGCSVVIGKGAVPEMPPGSLKGLQLVVNDLRAARAELLERGVAVSEIQQMGENPSGDPLDNVGFFFFSDPDGNGWAVQQISIRA